MKIRLRLMIALGLAFVAMIILVGIVSHELSERSVLQAARAKGHIISDYDNALRKFFRVHQRPLIMELAGEGRFIPDIMSGFVIGRRTFDIFEQNTSGYVFRQATIDPLHPPNKANEQELKWISMFANNPELQETEGVTLRDGKRYFYMARPMRVESKACLRCHGDPQDAPVEQLAIYGSESGYHWNMGDTVAAVVVYVSIEDALAAARASTITFALLVSGLLVVGFIIIWVSLNRIVVRPIIQLSARTEEISLGKNLTNSTILKRKDEIGTLSNSLERLRVSIVRALKR